MDDILEKVVIEVINKFTKGGRGSGNWGHAGRPNPRGGSRAGGGLATIGASPDSTHAERTRISRSSKLDQEILELLNSGTDSSVESKIVPSGRAPSGQGREYALRRSVRDKINSLKSRRSQHQQNINNSRGARGGKLGRRVVTRSNIMISAIDEALGMAREISQGILDNDLDFLDAKDIFDDIFNYTSSVTGGIKSVKATDSPLLRKYRRLAKKFKKYQNEKYPELLRKLDEEGKSKGGPGSGNFGHSGRPGLRGGSGSGGGSPSRMARENILKGASGIESRIAELEKKDAAISAGVNELLKEGKVKEATALIKTANVMEISQLKKDLDVVADEFLRVDNPTKVIIDTELLDNAFFRGDISEGKWEQVKAESDKFRSYMSEDGFPSTDDDGEEIYISMSFADGRATAREGSFGSHDVSVNGGRVGQVAHELAHVMEFNNSANINKSLDFWDKRTAGESLQSLRDITGNDFYSPSEVTKPDNFSNPYTGKIYRDGDNRYTEIFSTGMGRMIADPVSFARDDPEFFDFIYNAARGN